MAATRLQTQSKVAQERESGGFSAGEHLIHDAIIGGPAWAAELTDGTDDTTQKFKGLNISVPSTTAVVMTDIWSGGTIGISNNTGVPVLVEFGLSESPTTVNAVYGTVILPPTGAVNYTIPGLRASVAKLTALATPTASSPSVIINYENSAKQL